MASVMEPSLNSRLSAMYNQYIRSKDGLQALDLLMMEAEQKGLESKELAVCYALRGDIAVEQRKFAQAYADLERARRMYPNGIEVVHGLINVHWRARDSENENPHVNDGVCAQYTKDLEELGSNDPRVLEFCSRVYASLMIYDDGIRCLKKARDLLVKQEGFIDYVNQMNKSMTEMQLQRYRTCPDEENCRVMRYLVELLDFQENTLDEGEKTQAMHELFERVQFLVSEYQSGGGNGFEQEEDQALLRKALNMVTFDGLGVTTDVLDLGRQIFVILEDASAGVEYMTKCMSRCATNLRAEILLSRSCFYEQLGDTSRSHEDFIASNGDGTGLGASKFVLIKSQIGSGWNKKEGAPTTPPCIEEKTREDFANSATRKAVFGDLTHELMRKIQRLESELGDLKRENEELSYTKPTSGGTAEELAELRIRSLEFEQIMKQQHHEVRVRDEVIQELRVEATCTNEYMQELSAQVDTLKDDKERLGNEVEELRKEVSDLESRLQAAHQKEIEQEKQNESSSYCQMAVRGLLHLLLVFVALLALLGVIFASNSTGFEDA